MENIIKTTIMVLFAVSVVVVISFLTPSQIVTDETAELTPAYTVEYALQDLIKTYEISEDTGRFLNLDSKVDSCEDN